MYGEEEDLCLDKTSNCRCAVDPGHRGQQGGIAAAGGWWRAEFRDPPNADSDSAFAGYVANGAHLTCSN